MIFGFNTDIRHEDTVYHVQSEAREGEQLLQTQVFVRGRCIGKCAIPHYGGAADGKFGGPAQTSRSNSNNPGQERMLRELQGEALDAIRDARLGSFCDKHGSQENLAEVKE